jgi:hypothetical protein
VFVLHAGERQEIVAGQVAGVLQAHVEQTHQRIGAHRTRLTAADQLGLQRLPQRVGKRRGREQDDRQQPQRSLREGRIRLQRLHRHAAVAAAEGDHLRELRLRQPASEFLQRRPDRKSGPQQFDQVEQRAGEREPGVGEVGQQANEIVGDVRGQRRCLVAGQGRTGRRGAGDGLEREHQRQGDGGVGLHGRDSKRRETDDGSSRPGRLSPGLRCG